MTGKTGKEQVHSQITIAECAYYAYFLMMFGARAIGLYEGMLVYNLSLVLGMLLFAMKVVLTKHTVSEYLMMGGLLLLSLVVYYNTGEKGLLLYMTMMLGMKNIPVRRIFKWATIIMAVAFPLTCLASITGIGRDNVFYAIKVGMGEVARHSLGYAVHNTAFTTYIILVVLVMYMLGRLSKRRLLIVSSVAFAGGVYVYLYTVSYTGMLVLIIYLFLNYYFQTRKQLSKLEKTAVQLVYPVCILFSVAGPLVIKGKMFDFIDKVLNNRWNYARYFLTTEPVTLFGKRFQEAPNGNYMIDSSFLYSFLQIGLVAFAVLTLLNLTMIHDCLKQDKRIEIAMILGFCVLGISDPFMFNLSYKNLLFLFAGELLYRRMENLEPKLPRLLTREILWFKAGDRTLDGERILPAKFKSWFGRFGSIFASQSEVMLLIGTVAMTTISGVYFMISKAETVIVSVDNIAKWEYIREGISVGFWGALLAVIVIAGVKTARENRHMENYEQ